MVALTVAGTLFALLAVAVLAYPFLDGGEVRRRERRVVREFSRLGVKRGLRGRFEFTFDRYSPNASRGAGSYIPANETDHALFDQIGAEVEGDAIALSARMLWTDRKIGIVGILIALLGAVLALVSAIA
jgi:hypothetical protein